jgi:hypothetical protein
MTKPEWEELEALLAECSIDEAEAILLGEAGSALEEGNLRKLGYCLRKLREHPRLLIEAVAQLLCGEHDRWKVAIARKGAGAPGDPTTRMRDIKLGERIAMAGFAGRSAKAAIMRKLKEEDDSLNWRRMLRAEETFLESVSTRMLRAEGEYVFPNEPKVGDSNSVN